MVEKTMRSLDREAVIEEHHINQLLEVMKEEPADFQRNALSFYMGKSLTGEALDCLKTALRKLRFSA